MRSVNFLLVLYLSTSQAAAADFNVSLDLQWDYCSDQLTLTCTHSEAQTDPSWVYNGTSADGVSLDNIPGAVYTESTSTRHVAVISGMDNVRAVDSFTFQCLYNRLNNTKVRSNKEQYYWGYAEVKSEVVYGKGFCYYNCTVDRSIALKCESHTNISVTSSPSATNETIETPSGVDYTISDLRRCQRYTVEVTAQVGAHMYTNLTEVTVTLGPGRASITNVTLFVGEEESQLKVSLRKSEDDCAGHETTIYTFLIGDQSINMTADMLGLRSFSKRGDAAEVTLTVPADMINSSVFNLTVMLSNTVEFMDIITSSTGGVRSALRSNTWTTTSDPYYCRYCNATQTVTDGSDPLAYGVASAVAVVLLMLACIIIAVAIGVYWKKCQSRQIDDFEHEFPAIATAATNLVRSVDVEQETQHEPIQSRQHSVLQEGGGADAVIDTGKEALDVSSLEESNKEGSDNYPVDETITTSQEKAVLEERDEIIVNAASDTVNKAAAASSTVSVAATPAQEKVAAGHPPVYVTIDHTNKGPIRAPPSEQFAVQYATVQSGGEQHAASAHS